MSKKPPCWSSDETSATVLMEYLKRASPQFIAAELEKLGLLAAADKAAAKVREEVAVLRASDRVYRHAVSRLSGSDVEHALCALGLDAGELDRRTAALLRVHRITWPADAGISVSGRERARFWRARLLARFFASMRFQQRVVMVTLAACAMMLAIAQTAHFGAMSVLPDDGSRFMQLAGPTAEW